MDDEKTIKASQHLEAAKHEHVPVGHEAQTPEDAALNRRINLKMDVAMLPLLSILYLFNGLDRSNVGNAETQGFTTDIGAQPEDLNTAVSLFFVTFVTFQPLSAAVGRYIGARNWIPILMFCWGVVTIGVAWIKGRGALIATRLLVGLFEAGFFPTSVAYLSFFYRRYDLAVRLALFYGQYAVAGAFSGAISYGVFTINGAKLRNWQYLFIIEGALTCLFAIIAWVLLPTGPGSAWYLSAEEKKFAAERMRQDSALYTSHRYQESGIEEDRLTKRDVIETAKDWKLWYVLVFNILASVPPNAFNVFLPLVVEGLGYSSLHANLMSVPPFVCGAVSLYLFAWHSDRTKERGWHIVTGILVSIIGLIVLVTVPSNGGKYAGLCIFLAGSYVSSPLTVAWLSGNTPEPGKRSLVLGVNGFGNLGGVIGSQLFRSRYAPGYRVPFFITLGIVIVAVLGYISYRFTLAWVNRRKQRVLAGMSHEDVMEERYSGARYADKKVTFIYGL